LKILVLVPIFRAMFWGGFLYHLAPGTQSMDALHGEEFAKMQQDVYEKEAKGLYANPGMCMGLVSYASVATPEELEATVTDIKKNSLAQTKFEKAQEAVRASKFPKSDASHAH
jgi:hypothetical protein